MRDYFRSRSTMQLSSTVDNFRQHLLHHNTSFIAFSMNELKKDDRNSTCKITLLEGITNDQLTFSNFFY